MAAEYCKRCGDSPDIVAECIKYAVYHDVAEAVIGDIPTPTKQRMKGTISELENEIFPYGPVSAHAEYVVKLADRIDALWFAWDNGQGRHAKKIYTNLIHEFMGKYKDNPDAMRLMNDVLHGDVML